MPCDGYQLFLTKMPHMLPSFEIQICKTLTLHSMHCKLHDLLLCGFLRGVLAEIHRTRAQASGFLQRARKIHTEPERKRVVFCRDSFIIPAKDHSLTFGFCGSASSIPKTTLAFCVILLRYAKIFPKLTQSRHDHHT